MNNYNIYYGILNGTKYRFTKAYKSEIDAINEAKQLAIGIYYKNEGKFGIPTYNQIEKESKMTGVSIENLYNEHIYDLCRYYAIPTEVDTISSKQLKFK